MYFLRLMENFGKLHCPNSMSMLPDCSSLLTLSNALGIVTSGQTKDSIIPAQQSIGASDKVLCFSHQHQSVRHSQFFFVCFEVCHGMKKTIVFPGWVTKCITNTDSRCSLAWQHKSHRRILVERTKVESAAVLHVQLHWSSRYCC